MGRRVPDDVPVPARPRKAPLWAKLFVVAGAVLVVTSTAAFAGGQMLASRYEHSVQRQDLLGAAAPAKNEPPKVKGPLTFLLLGSDSRAGENYNPNTPDGSSAAVAGQRSDSIILINVPKTMDRAFVISVPRDTYIPIADKQGQPAGRNKINAAFAFGGVPRVVQTLNNFTGDKIDYPVIIDFAAIHKITDLVGGVDVVVDKTAVDTYRKMPKNTKYAVTVNGRGERLLTFKKGPLHLDGQLAEYYVRQRVGLPNGDLDRAKRQQQYLRALMSKVAQGDILTNPAKFDKFLVTVAGSLTVDKRMPVKDLAFALKGLRQSDLTFMTVPTSGFGNEPGVGSVVYPDLPKAQELFTALRNGTLDQYVLKYPPNDVSHGA